MTNERDQLDPELEELRQSYRAIRAPANTAARVLSTAQAQTRPRGSLRLAYAGTALVVGILAVLPFMTLRESAPDQLSMLPSLTAVSRAMPAKSGVSTPSLSRVRSVSMPAMPKRPGPNRSQDTQSNFDTDDRHDRRKEENHEFV